MKTIRYQLLITLTILLGLPGANPQATTVDEARQLSQQAQNLQADKRWDEAANILNTGLQNCGTQDQAKTCRTIMSFSLGYLYQKRYAAEAQDNKNHLARAAHYYRQALSDQPRNTQIMNNLALVLQSSGDWQKAADLFEQLASLDDEKRASYLIARGDLYRENDQPAEALKSYERALKHNPSDQTANRKMLSAYHQLPDEKITDLFKYSIRLKEIGLSGLAKDGFEQVIHRTYESNIPLSEAALVHWAEVLADNDWVSAEEFRRLPDLEKWQSDAAKGLQGLVNNPQAVGSESNWWNQNYIRRHVTASFLKAIADDLQLRGNVKKAAGTYEIALHVAPEFYRYDRDDLRGKPVVSMNIALALASMYHKYPELLDPKGRQFRGLVNELFNEKALHYARKDLMAIQRSHTVLGLIYAEKGHWTSDWRAANAIFQLDHALQTAKNRVEIDPKNYQPLPHLQSLLAEGYSMVGRPQKAFPTYIDAAMGYLDLDDLRKADQMIAMARSLPAEPSAAEQRRLIQIETPLRSRQEIQQLRAQDFDPKSAGYYGKREYYRWIFNPEILRLDPSFVNRQRFKALSDMGNRAALLKAPQEALKLQSQALKIIQTESSLSSMQDIVRLNQIKNSFRNLIHLPRSEQVIGTGKYLETSTYYKQGKIWALSLSLEQQPLQVGVGRDFILSGKITESLSRDPMLSTAAVKLDVRNGNVDIIKGQSSPETINKASTVIKNVEGVRNVQIK